MSVIEIGLAACIVILFIWNVVLMLDKEDKLTCGSELDKLRKALGYTQTFYDYHTPDYTVHQRINLLMDHLNLEIKEGEPSTTVLVKKKPIKRGK